MVLLLSARELTQQASRSSSISESGDAATSTPFASRRFSIPGHADPGPKIVFHFLGLGYELQDELPGRWVFERGTAMGAMTQTDIREYPTRLTVLAVEADEETHLISCHWTVNLMGGWAGRSDERKLEAEGRDLKTLLAGKPQHTVATEEAQDSTGDSFEIEQEVNGPALAMIVFGILILIGHLGMVIFWMDSHHTVDQAWLWVPGIFSGGLTLLGGLSMRGLRSLSWARMWVIGGLLPLTPAWVILAFIAVWAHQTLQKPEIKAAFLAVAKRKQEMLERMKQGSSDLDLDVLKQEASGPSMALIFFGAICFLGHAIFCVMLLPSHESEMAPITIPGILTGLGMFYSGLSFRSFKARGATQVGLIIGMIPINMGWLITFPICLWSMVVFQRPLIKQAFLDRSRRWNRASQIRREQHPGLRK